MSRAETARIVIEMAARFPSSNVDKATIAAYVDDLAGVELNALRAAVAVAIRNSEYFPPLKKIWDAMERVLPDEHIDPELVWETVYRAIKDVGYYRTPEFKDPLILKAIEGAMGSWQSLCDAPIEDRPSNRSRIIQAYSALVKRSRDAANAPPALRDAIERARSLKTIGSRPGAITDLGGLFAETEKELKRDRQSAVPEDRAGPDSAQR